MHALTNVPDGETFQMGKQRASALHPKFLTGTDGVPRENFPNFPSFGTLP